ncbi:MAG: sigma-54-dependent transcriptional regulator [Hyphomicrobiales bacterium]
MNATILVIDDDAGLRRALQDRLEFWGHTVDAAPDGDAGLERAAHRAYDVILLDLSMPGRSGMEVLRALKAGECGADVVVLTAYGTVEAAVEAIRGGAADFLLKPADFDLLQTVLERLLERRSLALAKRALEERIGATDEVMAGASPAMRTVLEALERVAPTDSTVLLTGESGSGKGFLAERIHARSKRRDGPLVYVNLVALSDDLADSALFGHEKGAFTGATARHVGKIEMAAGGTAFLDEIGDITPRLQTKLLHFLESKEFERVGGARTFRVDARLIAATNRDLGAAVREGTFREDLLYRINAITLRVPPLRERREEIPVLIEYFLRRIAADIGLPTPRLATRTSEILAAHPWQGNVRQLRNVIERMVVLARTDTLTPDLLPPEFYAPAAEAPDRLDTLPLKDAMLEYKRAHVQKALARAGGNQTRAAELLGILRPNLSRMIKELGVDPSRYRDATGPDTGS